MRVRRENGVQRSAVVPIDAIADAGAVEGTCAPPPSTVPPKVGCLTIVFSIGRGACGRRLAGLVEDPPLPPLANLGGHGYCPARCRELCCGGSRRCEYRWEMTTS